MSWSPGQIVVILILAPTLVELIYSEYWTWQFEMQLPKYQTPNVNAAATLNQEQSSKENTASINASHEHPSNGRQTNLETLAAGKRRMPGTHMRAHSL